MADPEKIKLLVVEDDPGIAGALSAYAERKGYAVLVANDGETARQMGERERPEVVLLDIALPMMDGRDVLAAWTKSGFAQQTVVVFLTARDAQSDRLQGLELGAAEYEVKPVHFDSLFRKIDALLRKKRQGQL